MKNERKRVFGTQVYVTFEGKAELEDGTPVKLYKNSNNRLIFKWGGKTYSLVKHVAEAFIGRSTGDIHFIDGDKSNVAAWNLQYVKKRGIEFSKYLNLYKLMDKDKKEKIHKYINDYKCDFFEISSIFDMPIPLAGLFFNKKLDK